LRSKVAAPIVVDLGRTGQATIRQFGAGTGQIIDDVEEVMRRVRLDVGAQDAARVFIPIVAVYTRVERRGDDDLDDEDLY
jgi:hypothetical protein